MCDDMLIHSIEMLEMFSKSNSKYLPEKMIEFLKIIFLKTGSAIPNCG